MRHYQKVLFYITTFVSCFALTIGITNASAWYTINTYEVLLELQSDWSMNVREDISVDFSTPSHGIVKIIPLESSQWYLDIKKIKSNHNISVSDNNNRLILTLWTPDKLIQWSQHYTISYSVQNAITEQWNWYEFHRNVIGDERDTSIALPSRTLLLPQAYNPSATQAFAAWGRKWETNQKNIIFDPLSDNARHWRVEKPLSPGQWITIWLQFEEWYFSLPSSYSKVNPQQDTTSRISLGSAIAAIINSSSWGWALIIIIVWIIGLIIVMLFSALFMFLIFLKRKIKWISKHRNTSWIVNIPITTQYDPPTDINYSQLFYLRSKGVDYENIFLAVLYHRMNNKRITITTWEAKTRKGKSVEYFCIKKTWLEPQNEGIHTTDYILYRAFMLRDEIRLDTISYFDIQNLFWLLKVQVITNPSLRKNTALQSTSQKNISDYATQLIAHLKGYQDYLSKVERPVLEHHLRQDSDYISKILPRAILFGVETRLSSIADWLTQFIDQYGSTYWMSFMTFITHASLTLNKININPKLISLWSKVWSLAWQWLSIGLKTWSSWRWSSLSKEVSWGQGWWGGTRR